MNNNLEYLLEQILQQLKTVNCNLDILMGDRCTITLLDILRELEKDK